MKGILPIILLSISASILYYLYNSNKEYAKYSEVLIEYRKDRNDFLNKSSKSPLKGTNYKLEYYEPNSTDFRGQLNISHVVHGYKDVFFKENRDYGDSGSCNNNVNCTEFSDWSDEIRSVAMILTSGGSRLCCLLYTSPSPRD